VAKTTFIVVTDADLRENIPGVLESFRKMMDYVPESVRDRLSLEVWDANSLLAKEHYLGIRVTL
jgi:hypothetical protein